MVYVLNAPPVGVYYNSIIIIISNRRSITLYVSTNIFIALKIALRNVMGFAYECLLTRTVNT